MLQASNICWFNESDLYCARTYICLNPEFRQFDRAKSIILYFPPKGTEGLLLFSVKGWSRSPCPPANNIVTVSRKTEESGKVIFYPLKLNINNTVSYTHLTLPTK